MLLVTGWGSAIVQALLPMLPAGEHAKRADAYDDFLDADRFLFCAGVLRPKGIEDQTAEEITESMTVNAISVIQTCDRLLRENDAARICIVGSESGFSWSFDGAYAAAKAAVHRYVETKMLRTPSQQLVCISPGIIEDAGMTIRRTDRAELARRRDMHPKRRYLRAVEVARMIHFLLYVDGGYTSGTIVRMHGGWR